MMPKWLRACWRISVQGMAADGFAAGLAFPTAFWAVRGAREGLVGLFLECEAGGRFWIAVLID